MSDPRIDQLTYEVKWTGPHRVNSPIPLEVQVEGFACVIEGTTMTARPSEDFRSVESARAVLEPGLRNWEIEWELFDSLPVHFDFQSASIIDARAGDGAHHMLSVHDVAVGIELASVERDRWPHGPSGRARSTPRLEAILARWHDLQEERERLLVAANWILTKLQTEFGGQRGVADAMVVSQPVLRKLGELCARNDPTHGRKAQGPEAPLSPIEVGWVRETVRLLVHRFALLEAGTMMPMLTMGDLPGLP